jgi:peptidoglycan pentaglycine glycine transferase (the first glycine)
MPDQALWLQSCQQLGFQTNPFSIHGRRSWVLDIQPDIEQLTAHFRKSWRQNIRFAERQGIVIREASTPSDFETYYRLLECSSRRDGFFIHPKEYHRQILEQFSSQGNAVLLIAEYQGQPAAAKMLIRLGDWCWDMFAGMSDDLPSLPKSHILQYHSILWAKSCGCKYFDFRTIPERLEPGEDMWGVYHFKKGFGGFSRLHMSTQDFVYRPLVYKVWHRGVRLRRAYARLCRVTFNRRKDCS